MGYVREKFPDGWTSFANAAIGEIGSTLQDAPAPAPTTTPSNPCAGFWDQCGGQDWSGSTCCEPGSTCHFVNQWYSQCLPGVAPTPAPAPAPTSTPTPEPSPSPEPEPTSEPGTTSSPSCPREEEIDACASQGGIYECKRCGEGDFSAVCCSCQGGALSSTTSTTTTVMTTTTTATTPRIETETTTTSPALSGKCKAWCATNGKSWEKKCKWAGCAGCSECDMRRLRANNRFLFECWGKTVASVCQQRLSRCPLLMLMRSPSPSGCCVQHSAAVIFECMHDAQVFLKRWEGR